MEITDTHQHLWDLGRFSYSWCRGVPALNRSFHLTDYLAAAGGLGIERTVFVEADVDEPDLPGETGEVLALAEESNLLAGVVAGARPESPDFPDYLDRFAGHPRLKGLRRLLHTQPDELSSGARFVANVRRLERYGLSFDLCVLARQLPLAIDLARSCPGVSFVLDHCGNPRIRERELDPWRGRIAELALLPNVACKISGIVTNAEPGRWTPDDLRPYVEHVISCFGWDRIMFGSDWPVCTLASSLGEWVAALRELTRDAGAENQRMLFQTNAARIYRL
jgi:predicted TIM-barrel fold metal-dependent hydrolase